jgi:hypothetical protein
MMEELALEGMRAASDEEEAKAVREFRQFLKEKPEQAVEILSDEL